MGTKIAYGEITHYDKNTQLHPNFYNIGYTIQNFTYITLFSHEL
jgi:hypothetical protein